MSEYTFDAIPLTEGLDFNTATSLAKPGSLRDVLNYEFVDGAGLKRIDGMRLYDGNSRNKTDKIFYILVTGVAAIASNSIFAERPWLYVDSTDNPNKIPFGHIAWNSATLPFDATGGGGVIIPIIRLDCPSYADPSFASGDIKILNSAVLTITEGTYSFISANGLTNGNKAAVYGTVAGNAVNEEGLLYYVQSTSYVSGSKQAPAPFLSQSLPNPVNVVWSEKLENTTYQISDCFVCSGTSAKQIYVGDYVYANSTENNFPALVLKAELNSGTWASGTATLHIVALNSTSKTEGYTRPLYWDRQCLAGGNLYLYRDTSAAAISSTIYTKAGYESNLKYQPDIACMYRVDSELGALTNDAVFSITEPGTEGTQYDLTNDAVTVSSGDAEAMPLISGGAVKAVIPTKRGTSYTSAPTFTIDASTGTAASSPVASLTNTINRTNWQFVHTGWKVTFDAGNRSYGYLNKIDRYRDIDGNSYSVSSSVASLEANKLIGRITATAPGVTSWFAHSGTGTHRWEKFGLWRNQVGVSDEFTMLGNVDTADSEYIYQKVSAASNPSQGRTAIVTLNSFPGLSAIPEGSSIKGIKITAIVDDGGDTASIPASLGLYGVLGVVRQSEFGGYVEKSFGSAQEFLTSGNNSLQLEITGGMSSTTFTAGSSTSIFGAGSIPIEDLLDPDFSIGLYLQSDVFSVATQFEVRIDHIYIDVYYELPSVRYYFADAAKNIVLHGDLVDYVVSSGSFEAGDAEGILTIANLRTIKAASLLTQGNSTTPYYTIVDNMDIYQDSGLTVKVGVVNGNMVFNGLDSYRTIKQNGSRYESIRANFFANDEYEAHYICSGAGRAGIWDGKYWSRIFAINPKQENADDLDKPRHVGVHAFHLFLGYQSGSVQHSAPGEPNNFSAFDGAGEIGIGDRVHGFNRLQGNAFGVFCEDSVHAITGSSAGDFATQTIVPNEGALEYSVASFGNRVIYTSKTGITTLDQTEKYGNFLGRRLSFDINPWLIPRITSGAGLFTSIVDFNPVFEAGNGFVCAYAVPHKNQYRVWFKDGLQLWMTLIGDDQPKFTFAQYFAAPGEYVRKLYALPLIPNYVSSQPTKENSNHTLLCPDREFVYALIKANGGLGQVLTYADFMFPGTYSLDVGDSFDGGFRDDGDTFNAYRDRQAIPHYSLINYQYLKNPFTSKTLRKVRLEGQTRGCAPLTIYADDGYKTSAQELRTTGTNISLPKTPLDELKLSFKPESTLASVAATGRVLSILLVGESLPNDAYFSTTGTDSLTSTRTTVPTPSHYLQALLLQFSEQGLEDA